MSYILEALKKADAAREREREAVPGLHSRHDHALPDEPDERSDTSPAARTPWLIGGVAGGVVIAGALFWLLGRTGHDAPPAGDMRPMPMHGQVGDTGERAAGATGQVPTPPVAGTMPAPVAAPPAPMAPPVVATNPAPVVQAPVGAPPAPPQTAPQPAVVTAPPPVAATRAPSPTPSPIPAPTAVTAATPLPTPAPTTPVARPPAQDPLRVDPSLREAGPKIVTLQELPDDIRRELPALSVGGAMHSDVAANRMLVLNGGVFREGDQPAPGVMLEEIRLKSAVLRYKGHRFSISY